MDQCTVHATAAAWMETAETGRDRDSYIYYTSELQLGAKELVLADTHTTGSFRM